MDTLLKIVQTVNLYLSDYILIIMLLHPRLKLLTVAHALILSIRIPIGKQEIHQNVPFASNKTFIPLTPCIVCSII